MHISQRALSIDPFYVMEVAKMAQALVPEAARSGQRMIFLNIGEPDFTAPDTVQAAAARVIAEGRTQYTAALGIEPLRQRISQWYAQRFGVQVAPQRIVITAGASGALLLACLAFVDAGEEVLMPDPSYPCNRHIISAANGRAVLLPSTAAERFQLTADQVERAWTPRTRGVLLASPSNPTGTSITPDELRRIHEVVQAKGGVTLIDEIYLGLSYDEQYGHTALALDDQVVSINSFSKYFNMTGWRLGWMVVPEAAVAAVEPLAQNLFICASTVAQQAALACFEPASIAQYEQRRNEFKARRDAFIPALRDIGFDVPVMPDGAFYAWADASPLFGKLGVSNSSEFILALMHKAHVVVTPSQDFGSADGGRFVRFSTASSMADLQEAAARMKRLLA